MPVPQSGTATTVVSTGTYDVARFGIEGQSVRAARGLVKPTMGIGAEKRPCRDPRNALRCAVHAERDRKRRGRTHADYFVCDVCCASA